MKRSDKNLLHDILEAAEKIEKFTKGCNKAEFLKNDLLESGVLLQFEIIGEAINHLDEEIKDKYSNVKWAKAVGFRNAIIHGYYQIDFKLVWKTVKNDLPELKKKVAKILGELGEL